NVFGFVIKYPFNRQLMIKPNTRKVLILADPFWSKPFQNGLAKALFQYDVPAVQFVDSLYAATFCTGGDTALVLDIGYHTSKLEAVSYFIFAYKKYDQTKKMFLNKPIHQASAFNFSLSLLPLECNAMQCMRVIETGRDFQVESEDVEAPIARTCFVAATRTQTLAETKANNVSYEFRVKKQSAFCKIGGNVRQQACDALFDEVNRINIAHFVCDALLKLPIDCRAKLVSNILITGGCACIPGFFVRFVSELRQAFVLDKYSSLQSYELSIFFKNNNSKKNYVIICIKHVRLVKCEFPSNIRNFVGGSIYGQLTDRFNEDLFLTKEEFESESKLNEQVPDWSDPKRSLITQEQMIRKYGPSPRAQGFRKAKDLLSNPRTSLTTMSGNMSSDIASRTNEFCFFFSSLLFLSLWHKSFVNSIPLY
ncbi:hypothetical protein RFI_32885, partial [Reticulomyxa filosa]